MYVSNLIRKSSSTLKASSGALVFFVLLGCSNELKPIVIKPADQFHGTALQVNGEPIVETTITYQQIDDNDQVTREIETTTSDTDGNFTLDFPRHQTYSSQYIIVVPEYTDFPMYGFVLDDQNQVDLESTLIYELMMSSPTKISKFTTSQISSLIQHARTVITKQKEDNLIYTTDVPLSSLRKAYKNALAADKDFMNHFENTALANNYLVVGLIPFGELNTIPSILQTVPKIKTPSVQEDGQLDMVVTAKDYDDDFIFYFWKVGGNVVSSGEITHAYKPSYDVVPWYLTYNNEDVEIIASDGGLYSSHTWEALVSNVPRPPEFTTEAPVSGDPAVPRATEEELWTYTPDAYSPDDAPFTIELKTGSFPSGMDMCLKETNLYQIAGTPCTSPGQIEWIPDNCQTTAPQTVQIIATDGAGASNVQTVIIQMNDINDLPVFTNTPAVLTASENVAWAHQPTVTDPQADPAKYPGIVAGSNPVPYTYKPGGTSCDDVMNFSFASAPTSASIDGDTGLINWTPTDAETGLVNFTIVLADGHGGTTLQSFVVTTQNIERAPYINYPAVAQTITIHEELYTATPFVLDIDFNDPDATDKVPNKFALITFNITGAPGSMTWMANPPDWRGSFPITDMDTPGTWNITAEICDANPNNYPLEPFVAPVIQHGPDGHSPFNHLCDQHDFTLDAPKRNIGPQFTSTPVTTATGTDPYVYNITAWDGSINPIDNITWNLDTGPAGMILTPGVTVAPNPTATLTWTPNNTTDLGINNITISATDDNASGAGDPNATLHSFSIFVAEKNLAPSITVNPPNPVLTAQNGTLYTFDLDATDPNTTSPNNVLTWSLDVAPSGMTIDPDTGLIEWMPTTPQAQVGTADVTVRVTDGGNPNMSDTYAFQFNPITYINMPATIDTLTDRTIAANIPFTMDILATDPDLDTIVLCDNPANPDCMDNKPAGATFVDNGDGTGLFSWTPPSEQTVNLTFYAYSTSGDGTVDTETVQLDVVEKPLFLSNPVTTTNTNGVYRYEVHVLDPSQTGLNYTLDVKPGDMEILVNQTNGEVTLNWTATDLYVGGNAVTIRATDNNGEFALQSFTLTVKNVPNSAPFITASDPVNSGTINVTEGVNTTFDLTTSDVEGDSVHVAWYWDDVWVYDASSTYNLKPGSTEAGDHVLKAVLTDGSVEVTETFNVHVRNTIPVLGSNYTFPTGTIKIGAMAERAEQFMTLRGGATPTYDIFDDDDLAAGPTKTATGFAFDPDRFSIRNDYPVSSLTVTYFADDGDIENGANSYEQANSDTMNPGACAGCWTQLFESTYSMHGGTQTVYDNGSTNRYNVKPSNRRYLMTSTGGTPNADADLGVGALGSYTVLDSANNKLFVSIKNQDSVKVLNATTFAVTNTINLAGGAGPTAMHLNSTTGKLYVFNAGNGSINEITVSNETVSATAGGLAAAPSIDQDPPWIMAGNDADRIIYIANADSSDLIVYDIDNGSVRTLNMTNAPNVIFFNSNNSRVLGASYSGRQVFEIR